MSGRAFLVGNGRALAGIAPDTGSLARLQELGYDDNEITELFAKGAIK